MNKYLEKVAGLFGPSESQKKADAAKIEVWKKGIGILHSHVSPIIKDPALKFKDGEFNNHPKKAVEFLNKIGNRLDTKKVYAEFKPHYDAWQKVVKEHDPKHAAKTDEHKYCLNTMAETMFGQLHTAMVTGGKSLK